MFVDDIIFFVFFDCVNVEEFKNIFFSEVFNVNEWVINNKLLFNCFKMKIMLIDGLCLWKCLSNEG